MLAPAAWPAPARLLAAAPAEPEALRRWAALLAVLALLGVIFVTALAVAVALRRARRLRPRAPRGPRRFRTHRLDPWFEAGRRAAPPPRTAPPGDAPAARPDNDSP